MRKLGFARAAAVLIFFASVEAAEPLGKFETVADPVLKKDIIANLIGAHKIYHPECKDAQVVGAKTLSATREKTSEEWVLSGCGRSYPYTIGLIPDGKGGTWINIPRGAPDPTSVKALGCKAPYSSRDDWLKIGESDSGTTYANVSSARLNGNIASMWLLSDYKVLQRESYGTFLSYEMLEEFDCLGKKIRPVGMNARAEKMATGPVVSCESIAYEWRSIRPGTSEEAASKIACDPDATFRYCKAPSLSASDWTKLNESNEEINYVNAKSAQRTGDIASVWILNDFLSAQTAGQGHNYWSVEMKYEFDCKANTRRISSQFAWEGKMASGRQVGCNLNRAEWKPIRTPSLGEKWRDIACNAPASK